MSSRPKYRDLLAKVPYYSLSPLKEIREKQEILFGLVSPPKKEPETPPHLPLSPEYTEVFSTPMSVFTMVDIQDSHIDSDKLTLPPPLEDLEIVDHLAARIAENDAILQSQYAAIEYNQTQLEYYANAINDYAAIFNYNQNAVDAQIKKLTELSQEITEKQAQLASLNTQITTMMTAQLLSALTMPITY
jgi:hypothetical protein